MTDPTPFQPTLPAEVPFTDAEHAFIDDSPPGIFPENQNSNFGFLRKLFADYVQDLIDTQSTLYNERFVETSTLYLDEWERMLGLPAAPSSKTVAQRRIEASLRLQRGPFTRSKRREVVEKYLLAVFGAPVELTFAGVPLTAGGVPLFAEAGDVSTSYTIRENAPNVKNFVVNSSYETNVLNWTPTNGTFVQSGAQNKFGTKSGLFTATNTSAGVIPSDKMTGIVAGQRYSASIYARRGVGTRTASIIIFWYTAADGLIGNDNGSVVTVSNTGMTRVTFPNVLAPATAAKAVLQFQTSTGSIGDTFYLDGAQFEKSTTVTDYRDKERHALYYEVRILASLAPDMVGLGRELDRITPAGISYNANLVTDL